MEFTIVKLQDYKLTLHSNKYGNFQKNKKLNVRNKEIIVILDSFRGIVI